MNSHKSKMIAPIIITIFVVLYYVFYFGLLVSVIEGWGMILLGIIPLLLSLVMIKVCIERIKEIREGEEDDLSKY